VWGTREALVQPIASEEYGPTLVTLMAFLGVPQEEQEFVTRPAPIPMDTEAPVLRVPMEFVQLTRGVDPADKTKKVIIAREASVLNETNPKVSTRAHPLRKYPLYPGGSADVEWCDKHALSCAVKKTTNAMKAFFREVMRMIRLIRNQHIWIALSTQASAVLEAKGCRELDDTDRKLRTALGPERLEAMKRINPAGLRLPVEACVTRWGLLYAGAAEMCANLLLFSALFPLALADGTHENKILAMQAVCSKDGFVDENQIHYTNPRVGQAVHYMTQPDHILRQHIVQFHHRFVWQPLLAACAHNKECAMTTLRGLGSLVLVVLWVLKRGIWTAGVGPGGGKGKTWKMHLQLGHRGPSQVQLAKVSGLFLSARLENEWAWRVKPKDFVSDGPAAQKMSPFKHLYGLFYTPAMEHGISDLQKAIVNACHMKLAADSDEPLVMLPADLRSSFPDSAQGGKQKRSSSTYWFRIQQAMWLLHRDACAAADALIAKYRLTMCDPQGYLAGMTSTEAHRILLGVFEFDGHGAVGTFYTSTMLARANAAILWLQARELLARNPNVADHLQSPLKQLYSPKAMIELKKFWLGAPVKDELEKRGTLLSDEDGAKPDISALFFPAMKFEIIAKLSMLAAARPTSNNAVESRWSILTGKYMSGMRNGKGLCLSQYAKQPDFHTFKMKEWMTLPSFLAIVAAAYCFVLEHFVSITSLFQARHDASQKKMKEMREDSAQQTYEDTNIRANGNNAKCNSRDNKKPAKTERRAQPRNKSNQLSASSGAESDDSENNWSADNSESAESIGQHSCASGDDAHDSDNGKVPPPVAAAQGNARKRQLSQQPTEALTSRMTRSQSQTIPNSADAADDDGSLSASPRVPSISISSSSSANSGEVPALAAAAQGYGEKSQSQQPSLEKPSSTDGPFVATSPPTRGDIVDDSSSQAAACSDAPGRASKDKSHLEPMSEDEVCDWTIHPVELKSDLKAVEAERLGRYRLNYTRWMLRSRKWQKTAVLFTKNARTDVNIAVAHLTRCDGVKFDLVARTSVFYVLHTPMGLELISVQSMVVSVNKLRVVVTFNRVLSTQRAVQAAHSREDLVDTLACDGRSIISTRLGSDNLSKLLIAQQNGATVVHEGDIAYTDFAHNIVGVVGSLTPNAKDKDDQKILLNRLRSNQCIGRKQAKDISCFDVVIQGPHFSDTAPPPTGYASRSIFMFRHRIAFCFHMPTVCARRGGGQKRHLHSA
jgi:hypothetical protein